MSSCRYRLGITARCCFPAIADPPASLVSALREATSRRSRKPSDNGSGSSIDRKSPPFRRRGGCAIKKMFPFLHRCRRGGRKAHYRCSRASNSRLIVSNTHSAFLNSVLFSNPRCSLVRGMFSTRDTERTTPSAPFKERAHFLGGAATPPSKGGDFSGQH